MTLTKIVTEVTAYLRFLGIEHSDIHAASIARHVGELVEDVEDAAFLDGYEDGFADGRVKADPVTERYRYFVLASELYADEPILFRANHVTDDLEAWDDVEDWRASEYATLAELEADMPRCQHETLTEITRAVRVA